MEQLNEIIAQIDDFVWGPVMLILLVGTGIFLTIRTRFLTWRNLGYALKSTLSKEATHKEQKEKGECFTVFCTYDSSCSNDWNRKYRRSCNSNGFRRTRSTCMDVDFRGIWFNFQVQ